MRTIWPYLALAAEILVFFHRVIFQPRQFVIPWDFQYFAYNLTAFIARSLHDGRFPLWDPYTYCGTPFYANLQAQVFYPPTLLVALAANAAGADHLMHFMILELAAHVFLAGVFTFWLLRAIDCAPLAALLGGAAFQLGCYFASQTQHFGAITGAVWLPLATLAVVRLSSKWSRRWAGILAVSLALPVLAGFPSTIFAVFFCTFVLTLTLANVRLLLAWIAAALLALSLAAIQLAPSIQLARLSVSQYRADFRLPGSGLRLPALASLLWPNYFHILDPRGFRLLYNFTFLYLYCGLIPLALAGLAVYKRPSRFALPFLILTLASFCIMMGDSTPMLGPLLTPRFLDLVHDTVYPEFLMLGFSFGISVLAGLGANRLSQKPALLAALLLFTVLDLTFAGSDRPMNTKSLASEPGTTARVFDGSADLLAASKGLTGSRNPPARLDSYRDSMGWSTMAPTIRIPTPSGNDPFALDRYMSVRRLFTGGTRWGRYYEISNLDSAILDLLNVGVVVSRTPLPPDPKYRLASNTQGHYFYLNLSVLPRFFLVDRIVGVQGARQGLEQMQSPAYSPAQVAVVEGIASRQFPPSADANVRTIHYTQNELELETFSPEPRFLVTSETAYPGWKATLDGQAIPIITTNVAFRGLEVPAGRHRVIFRFQPGILWWAGLISAISLLATLWIVVSPVSASLDIS